MNTQKEEQKQRATERRQKMRSLAREIGNMPVSARMELAKRTPATTIEGHTLSPFNCCFLAHQNPNVTIVGGFRQWKKAGRSVCKGEHGLALWIPVGCKKANGDDSETIHEESDVHFLLATVFDVSQTKESEATR